MRRLVSLILSLVLISNQVGFAQQAAELGLAQYLGKPAVLSGDTFRPLHLRYLSYDSLKDGFELYLDKGDWQSVGAHPSVRPQAGGRTPGSAPTFREEAQQVFNYFQIGLRLPNEVFWVNLRPDSPQRIIDDSLAKTDIGKVFLEADLQLKIDLAMATSPETSQGKAYWDKLYKKAEALFGAEQVEIPTYTRPWIVPGEIILSETKGSREFGSGSLECGVYVYKAMLKVMLEEDYVGAGSKPALQSRAGLEPAPTIGGQADPRYKVLNAYSSELLRETIIPELTKAVNRAKRYAALRQVYYSLILAQWFKKQNAEGRGQKAEGRKINKPANSRTR